MTRLAIPDAFDIHALIQERKFDMLGLIRQYADEIDLHVETCSECHRRVVSYTQHLPRLFARMVVQLPEPAYGPSYRHDLGAQLRSLERGQCLPCGCVVTDTPWTREEAAAKFYVVLAEILQLSLDHATRIHQQVQLIDLPLAPESLRRLRDAFWLPSGSMGDKEARDAEEGENVLQLPDTVADMITKILELHSSMVWVDCSEHWSP